MKYEIVPVTAFQQNCSIIWCENTRKAAIVDPGGEPSRILASVEQAAVEVERILLTHGHIDHVGATAELVKRLSVPVEGPQKEDDFWLRTLQNQSRMFAFPPVPTFQPDRWLEQGDEVSVGELRLQVLHCPGHTPGHIVFYEPQSKVALAGDVLFRGSVGRSDFPRGDHDQLIASIRERLLPLGDDVVVLPGHGPQTTLGEERRSNPFLVEF